MTNKNKLTISIITLFPEMFTGPFDFSIIKRAIEKGIISLQIIDLREFGIGKHKTVDDTPYGGGTGMVLRADVIKNAVDSVNTFSKTNTKIILMGARGRKYEQETAKQYSKLEHLIIICGHYEGVDERIMNFIDEEISIGDFITTGGEIPAMAVTDSVARLAEGVLKKDATAHESFSLKDEAGNTYIEYPQYTKPQIFESLSVPDVLLSGNHKEIEKWKKSQSLNKTKKIRPELIKHPTEDHN